MIRFRNRFTAKPVESRTCRCGRFVSFEVSDGRETVIHELPWCDRFRELMAALKAAGEAHGGDVSHHIALMESTVDRTPITRTLVIADGDSAADVDVTGRDT
jgi:hypothetical protein